MHRGSSSMVGKMVVGCHLQLRDFFVVVVVEVVGRHFVGFLCDRGQRGFFGRAKEHAAMASMSQEVVRRNVVLMYIDSMHIPLTESASKPRGPGWLVYRVSNAGMSLIPICAPAQMWKEGTEVERDIDGCWFRAVVLSFERGGTFTVRWTGLHSQRLHACTCVCVVPWARALFSCRHSTLNLLLLHQVLRRQQHRGGCRGGRAA